jgi:hypothetical protein
MAEHLGRNPFSKKNTGAKSDVRIESTKKSRKRKHTPSRMRWLMVELPAQSILIAIKTYMFAKGLLGRSARGQQTSRI